MTTLNIDVKCKSVQASYDFSLVHASNLLNQMNDIQNFLLSGAICELPIDVSLSLQQRQSELLSEVSTIVHYNKKPT